MTEPAAKKQKQDAKSKIEKLLQIKPESSKKPSMAEKHDKSLKKKKLHIYTQLINTEIAQQVSHVSKQVLAVLKDFKNRNDQLIMENEQLSLNIEEKTLENIESSDEFDKQVKEKELKIIKLEERQ